MSQSPDVLRPLTVNDLDEAVRVQSAAFIDDPLWRSLYADVERRQGGMRRLFRVLFGAAIRTGQAYGVGAPLGGVTVWSGPADPAIGGGALLASGALGLLFSPFILSFGRAFGIFSRFEAMQKQYAPMPHYYLNTISVAPEAQGRGVASRLIRPFLARADAEGVPTYTETITPENVGLYQHYGFRVMEAYSVPGSDLRLWAFLRPAPVLAP